MATAMGTLAEDEKGRQWFRCAFCKKWRPTFTDKVRCEFTCAGVFGLHMADKPRQDDDAARDGEGA